MATTKWHLSQGEARPCRAEVRGCPVGGVHFVTKEEAEGALTQELAAAGSFAGASHKQPTAQARARALFEYAKQSELAQVREGLPGLYVVKYTRRVFYDGLWNQQLENCRGVVFTEDGAIAALPFTKIYNDRVEKAAPEIGDEEKVHYARKVNGYMGAFSFHKGKPLYSTTGSLTSDYVTMFQDMMTPEQEEQLRALGEDRTYLFEVVNPQDPHIIQEESGLYLLGARKKELDSPVDLFTEDQVPQGLKAVPTLEGTMGEVREQVRKVHHEGFVAYTEDGRSVKTKSPYYLTSKFMARGKVTKLLGQEARQRVEEEYYPLLDAVKEHQAEFEQLDEQGRLKWVNAFLQSQDYFKQAEAANRS